MKEIYIKLTILIVLYILTNTVQAQQTPVFANYSYNAVIINPAHAGYCENTDVTLTNTGFFNSVDGSPKNIALIINTLLESKHVGLAVGGMSDQIGVTRTSSFFGSYSYKIFFDSEYQQGKWWAYDPNMISFGITAGASVYDEDLMGLKIENDPNFQANIHEVIPNLGFGFLYNRDAVYWGISASNVLGSSFSTERNLNLQGVYYTYFGYRVFTNRFEEVLLNPSALIKYVEGAPLQVDLNLIVNYKNFLEMGIGYRTSSTVNFLAGFHIGANLKLLYTYNYALDNYAINNAHGFVVNYNFGER